MINLQFVPGSNLRGTPGKVPFMGMQRSLIMELRMTNLNNIEKPRDIVVLRMGSGICIHYVMPRCPLERVRHPICEIQ